MAASANPLLLDTEGRDPTLFATAFKKQRFYIFSRSEPEWVTFENTCLPHHSRGNLCRDTKGGDRDIFNEKPTREEQTVAMETQPVKVAVSGRTAVIHTTKGDIVSHGPSLLQAWAVKSWLGMISQHFRLHPEYAPKAVENFVEHSKNGYYNGIIFHRIIKKFVSTSSSFDAPIG
jgi:peptidylprolyl isomerase domain and WD repeat-containing protein 1